MKGKMIMVIRSLVILSAAAMITYGIFRGEVSIVTNKAASICFECIGLGK